VVPVDTEDGKKAIALYGWEKAGHGLVTLKTTGESLGNLPGHNYGKDEIKVEIEKLLNES
jgi:hypothetical protein